MKLWTCYKNHIHYIPIDLGIEINMVSVYHLQVWTCLLPTSGINEYNVSDGNMDELSYVAYISQTLGTDT